MSREDIDFQADLAKLSTGDLPEITGVPMTKKKKRAIVREMWAEAGFEEACLAHDVSPRQAVRWRLEDPRFDFWCSAYEFEQEHVQLKTIAGRVLQAAQEDPKLGLQVLKARHPDWSPTKRVVHEEASESPRTKFIPTRGVVDAQFRELPSGEQSE